MKGLMLAMYPQKGIAKGCSLKTINSFRDAVKESGLEVASIMTRKIGNPKLISDITKKSEVVFVDSGAETVMSYISKFDIVFMCGLLIPVGFIRAILESGKIVVVLREATDAKAYALAYRTISFDHRFTLNNDGCGLRAAIRTKKGK